MITLEIPRVPASPNNFIGKHWRFRHRNSQVWQQEVNVALLEAGYTKRVPFQKARITIDRRGRRELDPDNLYGCVKPVLDALRYAHVLVDDSPAHLELEVTQSYHHKLPPRTLIKIQPINV